AVYTRLCYRPSGNKEADMSRTGCLTREQLVALHLGDLAEAELDELTEHLACPRCEEAARELEHLGDALLVGLKRQGPTPWGPATIWAGPPGGARADPLPARVGQHEVLGELGRGGMGVVFKARHLVLGRLVALKMLLGAEFADPSQRARFRSECRAIA